MKSLKLYSYFRSSSAYRVRIALHLKGLDYEYLPIHLLKGGGEQRQTSYLEVNPMAEVPTLVHGSFHLSQSMAILLYLDQCFPKTPLFPKESEAYGRVIQVCEIINSGIQPIQNLSVLQKLSELFEATEEQKKEWNRYWIGRGLEAFDKLIAPHKGLYSLGDQVCAADLYLIPQLFNAKRFGVQLEQWPRLLEIESACLKLEAFEKSEPKRQPDYPSE